MFYFYTFISLSHTFNEQVSGRIPNATFDIFLFFDKLRNAMIKLSVSTKNFFKFTKMLKKQTQNNFYYLSFLASENQRLSQRRNASSSKLRFYIQLSLLNTVSVFILRVNIYDKHFAFRVNIICQYIKIEYVL